METNKIDAAKIFVFFILTVFVGYFVFFSGGNTGQQARIVTTDQTTQNQPVITTNTMMDTMCPKICGASNVNQLMSMMKMPKGCTPGVYDDKTNGVGACSATVATSTGQCVTYKGKWEIATQNGIQNKFCYTGVTPVK